MTVAQELIQQVRRVLRHRDHPVGRWDRTCPACKAEAAEVALCGLTDKGNCPVCHLDGSCQWGALPMKP